MNPLGYPSETAAGSYEETGTLKFEGPVRGRLDRASCDRLARLLLDMGELMLLSGAEIHHVEETLDRIGAYYGMRRVDSFVITATILITLEMPDGRLVTHMRRITSSGGTDFTVLEYLEKVARRCRYGMSLDGFAAALDAAPRQIPPWMRYIGSSFAAGFFAVFFGGGAFDGVLAGVFGIIICLFKDMQARFGLNAIMFNLLSSFFIGMLTCQSVRVVPGTNQDMIMIGDIMLLVSGILMTNGVRDMLTGDTISGFFRLIESVVLTGALSLGFMVAIWLSAFI